MLDRIITIKGLSIRIMRFYHQAKQCWPYSKWMEGTTYYRRYEAINTAGKQATFSNPASAWAHARS